MQHHYRIAILDMNAGQPNEGMRCIKMLVEQFLGRDDIQGDYRIFDVRVHHEIPEVEDFDIFIASGGPDSPKPTGEPWEKKFNWFLDSIYDHNLLEENKKYLFLICHSFQIACLHWKLAKVKRRKSTAFGIMPVHKTKKGKEEFVLEGLQNPFYAVDSRDYQVVKPRKKRFKSLGCKVLCKEKKRPHVPLERAVMAIRFSKRPSTDEYTGGEGGTKRTRVPRPRSRTTRPATASSSSARLAVIRETPKILPSSCSPGSSASLP